MAEDYAPEWNYPAPEHFMDSRDIPQNPPSRFEKVLKVFIIFACMCLAGELIWLLGISPFRQFSRIDITGFDGMAREDILHIAGISESSSFFTTETRAIEKALMNIGSIESAKVFKYFPGRLHIVLENRRPVAQALSAGNVPLLFDSNGIIFQVGRAAVSAALPLVSGLEIQEPFPGMRLPPELVPFFRELEKIEISAPELLSAISEFRIVGKEFEGYDLLLYPVHKKIKVRMRDIDENLLRYALLMIDVLSSREEGLDTLDFRSGIASYISRGGTPQEAYSE